MTRQRQSSESSGLIASRFVPKTKYSLKALVLGRHDFGSQKSFVRCSETPQPHGMKRLRQRRGTEAIISRLAPEDINRWRFQQMFKDSKQAGRKVDVPTDRLSIDPKFRGGDFSPRSEMDLYGHGKSDEQIENEVYTGEFWKENEILKQRYANIDGSPGKRYTFNKDSVE